MIEQAAEVVPGLLFRGRRVYLEKYDAEVHQDEHESGKPGEHKVRSDCVVFAAAIMEVQKTLARMNTGLIIQPGRFPPSTPSRR